MEASIAVHLGPALRDALVLTHSASATVREMASLVLVGADTVYEDGTIRNKIGTRSLAEAAQRQGVRTLVACEVLKLVPVRSPSAEDEPDLRDTTPPDLIDEIVTEEGPTMPEDVKSLIERTPFLRDGYRFLTA